MKKITLLLTLFCFQLGYSQVLNEPANWPNENWTTSGEYTATGLIAEPSTSDSFTFDDDAAGNTSSSSNTETFTTSGGSQGSTTTIHEGFFESGWDGWSLSLIHI